MVLIGKNKYKFGRMYLSHMASDSLAELHDIAEKLGVRKHFQNKKGKPHYDICQSNKLKAIQLGAVEVSDKEIIKMFRSSKDELDVFIKSSVHASLYDFPELDFEIENELIRQKLSKKFIWCEVFADNGEHSHFEVKDNDGCLLWASGED